MVKLVAISDTHTKHDKLEIPECDILVHTGDFSYTGKFSEVRNFARWLKIQPAQHKIVIAGNHEETFDVTNKHYDFICRDIIAQINDPSIHYLENDHVTIEGIKFYGTPWTPWFYDWGFNGHDGPKDILSHVHPSDRLLDDIYGFIPEDTDVLLCHGPPYQVLDMATDERCGSVSMHNLLFNNEKLEKLMLYLCGHVHEARGHDVVNDIHFCNVASLGRDYMTVMPPVIIHLDEDGVQSIEGY